MKNKLQGYSLQTHWYVRTTNSEYSTTLQTNKQQHICSNSGWWSSVIKAMYKLQNRINEQINLKRRTWIEVNKLH